MPPLTSSVNPSSDAFQQNATEMASLHNDLTTELGRAALGGDERSRDRHVARGKMLPRDRVENLLSSWNTVSAAQPHGGPWPVWR